MDSKLLFTFLLILGTLHAKWSPGKIAGAAIGGAALLGGGALLASSLLGKKGNSEEDKLRAKLTKDIADKRVERSQKRTELNSAKAQLDQDLSELQTTMDIMTGDTKDKIEDIATLLDASAATKAAGGERVRMI